MGFFSGTPAKIEQVSPFNEQQKQAFSTVLNQALQQLGQQPTPTADILQPVFSGAQKRFQEETIPSLLEQFRSQGQLGSGRLQSSLAKAGSDLQQGLGEFQAQAELGREGQQQNRLFNLLNLGLQPQSQTLLTPRVPGFFENLAGTAASELGRLLPSVLGAGASSIASALPQLFDNSSPIGPVGPDLSTGLSRNVQGLISQKLNSLRRQGPQRASAIAPLVTNSSSEPNLSSLLAPIGGNPPVANQNIQQPNAVAPASSLTSLSSPQQPAAPAAAEQVSPIEAQAQALPNVTNKIDKKKSSATSGIQKKPELTESQRIKNRQEIKKDIQGYIKEQDRIDQRLKTLDRFENLDKKGEIDSPSKVKFLKTLGLDFLLSPGSQEFEAGTKDFLGDLKTIFGGKVSDFEVDTFLKAIPQLSNSKEGRKRIIKNLKLVYEAEKLEPEVALEVARENNDLDPLDFTLEVNRRVAERKNELSNQINESLREGFKSEKDIPEGVIVRKNNKEFVKRGGKLVPL